MTSDGRVHFGNTLTTNVQTLSKTPINTQERQKQLHEHILGHIRSQMNETVELLSKIHMQPIN